MNCTNTTTTVDALALHIADITAVDASIKGASIAEAMATAGTLELATAEWAAMIDGDRAERIEEEFDWIGAATLQS